MKKLFSLLFILLLSCGALRAQLREVIIDIYGNYVLVVEVDRNVYAELSEYGDLLDIYSTERPVRSRNSRGDRIRRPTSFKGIRIDYYDNFWDYKAGKISSIGNVRFDYHNDFWKYKAGKLENVGTMRIDYHNDFWDYNSGKVSNIGHIRFSYHSDFWPEKSGLLERVNSNRYDYRFTQTRPRSESMRGSSSRRQPSNSPIVTGERELNIGGIRVFVTYRL